MVKAKSNEPKEANLSTQQIQAAIPKIKRRIKDLQSVDVNSIQSRSDANITALEQQLDTLLTNIFGSDTVEYRRYRRAVTDLDRASLNMMGTPLHEIREGFVKGINISIETLEAIIKGFNEDLEDAGLTTSGRALRAYDGLELHEEIERAAGNLYKDGHYANAVEDATKALNGLVRLRSGLDDKDGTSLMEAVFNPKQPVLKFNDLADQSDLDEQRGFMMMFSGAVAGLRNPRAHKIIKDDPEIALEYIAYISMLAKLVDKAVKNY